jgi:hypothetical protein
MKTRFINILDKLRLLGFMCLVVVGSWDFTIIDVTPLR